MSKTFLFADLIGVAPLRRESEEGAVSGGEIGRSLSTPAVDDRLLFQEQALGDDRTTAAGLGQQVNDIFHAVRE